MLDVRPGREEVEADSGWEDCDCEERPFSVIVGIPLWTERLERKK